MSRPNYPARIHSHMEPEDTAMLDYTEEVEYMIFSTGKFRSMGRKNASIVR